MRHGNCHSVWVASDLLVGLKLSKQQTRRHPYRVTNTIVAQIQQFSPDDGHMVARNMQRREINKYIKQNCAPSWIYLQDFTGMHGQQSIKLCMYVFGQTCTYALRIEDFNCRFLWFVTYRITCNKCYFNHSKNTVNKKKVVFFIFYDATNGPQTIAL